MQALVQKYILRNRYTLLLTVIVSYVLVIVLEGAITNREPQSFMFENPYFDLDVNDTGASGADSVRSADPQRDVQDLR